MNTLHLKYASPLQGEFKPSQLNFLFVFQVNCPGCFFYGIPVVNELYLKHRDNMSFLGLSTAFEDFELNTQKNTKLLLDEAQMVGETKKALLEQGHSKYSQDIDFPIAMDLLVAKKDFINQENIERICHLNPNYGQWPSEEQKRMQKNVENYLAAHPTIPSTFTLNQLRGTPTFVLFDKEFRVMEHWFGHKTAQEINEILAKWL